MTKMFYPLDGVVMGTRELIEAMVRQANENNEVVYFNIQGITIYVAPGDNPDDLETRYELNRRSYLEAFVAQRPDVWGAFLDRVNAVYSPTEAQKAEERCQKALEKKAHQAERQRKADEARRKKDEKWITRWSAPVKKGNGPEQLNVEAWNELVHRCAGQDETNRFMVEYAFRMAWIFEEKFASGQQPSRREVLEADQKIDCFGFSGGMTAGALSLLIDRWPYARALIDIYNGVDQK